MTRRSTASLAALLIVLVLGPVPRAGAATFTVTKTTDSADGVCDADCSLREAITAANTAVGPDTIVLPAGTYDVTVSAPGDEEANAEGDLDITGDTTIIGAGMSSTIIDGNGRVIQERIITMLTGGAAVSISGVTLRNGQNPSGNGGIYSAGSLTLTDVRITENTGYSGAGLTVVGPALTMQESVVSDNTSTGVGGLGGGMQIVASTVATLTNVTVSGNTAKSDGGGMYLDPYDGGSVTLTNVTVSGNSSDTYGGGIAHYDDAVSLNNVTITGNRATNSTPGFGKGGGIYSDGTFAARNTIIAGNTANQGAPDCWMVDPAASGGHNLVRDTADCPGFTGPGDLTGVDPLLGSLADNGGPTQTHALLPGSPAIDAGGTDCTASDQRGVPRTGTCDMGAYELALCLGTVINRVGTSGNDTLLGTSVADAFLAQGGNDVARGPGGERPCVSGARQRHRRRRQWQGPADRRAGQGSAQGAGRERPAQGRPREGHVRRRRGEEGQGRLRDREVGPLATATAGSRRGRSRTPTRPRTRPGARRRRSGRSRAR
jgi:CSLREA domain-containing protein